eukprot:Gb_12695 [translate_table: standard]
MEDDQEDHHVQVRINKINKVEKEAEVKIQGVIRVLEISRAKPNTNERGQCKSDKVAELMQQTNQASIPPHKETQLEPSFTNSIEKLHNPLIDGDKKNASTMEMLMNTLKDKGSANSTRQHLALLCLGKIGKQRDLLDDATGDVSESAVKCLAPLVKDIASIELKTIVFNLQV